MENKFTDNEIIKALEYCFSNDFGKCEDCPLKSNLDEVFSCMRLKQELALDLTKRLKAQNKDFDEKIVIQRETIDWQAKEINRQKAEIERLNVELVGMRGACESYKIHYDNAKAEIAELQRRLQEGIDLSDTVLKIVKSEARKEFAELIKQSTTDKSIDELLEEMEDADKLSCKRFKEE